MRARFIACVLTFLTAAPFAAAEDGCARFDWRVDRELELFNEGFFADVESQSALPKDGAFSMLLQPIAQVIYTVPPERGRDDGYGGIVTLEWIAAGRYQITLSGDAWIDAVQNDKRLPMLVSTSRDDCPGIRMSVQFDIQSVPLTLQFGGAMVRRLNISILRVREKYGIDSWRP
ncbi:hypothetical protein SAMN02990966_00585 [Rhodospirillales bacterium URHD0017]|nr:hypothetical protein SAMN02990966_00585 [Rhodospirillales bacterium URHD0017]